MNGDQEIPCGPTQIVPIDAFDFDLVWGQPPQQMLYS